MERKAWIFVGGTFVALAAFGCDKSKNEAATTATTGAMMPNDDAVTRLSSARCERQEACDGIGPGKAFPNREACLGDMTLNMRSSLRADQCPMVNEKKLKACTEAIKERSCDKLPTSLDMIPSCESTSICGQQQR